MPFKGYRAGLVGSILISCDYYLLRPSSGISKVIQS